MTVVAIALNQLESFTGAVESFIRVKVEHASAIWRAASRGGASTSGAGRTQTVTIARGHSARTWIKLLVGFVAFLFFPSKVVGKGKSKDQEDQ